MPTAAAHAGMGQGRGWERWATVDAMLDEAGLQREHGQREDLNRVVRLPCQ